MGKEIDKDKPWKDPAPEKKEDKVDEEKKEEQKVDEEKKKEEEKAEAKSEDSFDEEKRVFTEEEKLAAAKNLQGNSELIKGKKEAEEKCD